MSDQGDQGDQEQTKDRLLATALLGLGVLFVLAVIVTRPAPVPDFASEPSVAAKKTAFFEYLRPYLEAANHAAVADGRTARLLAEKAVAGPALDFSDRLAVDALGSRYLSESEEALELTERLAIIALRADVVPEPLALIQAAKESGWGGSRFAVEGYNFFGQRCFEEGCGMRPEARGAAGFEVASFPSPHAALASYVQNLNTHPRYAEFRAMRGAMRARGEALDSLRLVGTLTAYSERGQDYVRELQSMLRASDL